MNIAVGCPVANRAWILPHWFEYVEKAFERAGVEPFYLFVYGTSRDNTLQTLHRNMTSGIVETVEESGIVQNHNWHMERYKHMVEIRNKLLGLVRETQPDLFLSLDSDILLHPDALSNLLEAIQEPDRAAVGGKCYLTVTGNNAPSYAYLAGDYGLHRPDLDPAVWRVDVIMAIKLMTRDAYSIDYRTSRHGEDIGFSNACREKGLSLWYDSRVCSKHVMEREMLDKVDPRCQY